MSIRPPTSKLPAQPYTLQTVTLTLLDLSQKIDTIDKRIETLEQSVGTHLQDRIDKLENSNYEYQRKEMARTREWNSLVERTDATIARNTTAIDRLLAHTHTTDPRPTSSPIISTTTP